MTFKYTPPEPACPKSGTRQPENLYTESQLRSEVERVRLEVIEECAAKLTRVSVYPTNEGAMVSLRESVDAIRSLK